MRHVRVVEVHEDLLDFLRAHVRDAQLVLVDHERLLQILEAARAIIVLEAYEGEREVNLGGVNAVGAELALKELLDERQVLQGLIIVVSSDRAVGQIHCLQVLLKDELLPNLGNLRAVAARLGELLLDAE